MLIFIAVKSGPGWVIIPHFYVGVITYLNQTYAGLANLGGNNRPWPEMNHRGTFHDASLAVFWYQLPVGFKS